MTDWKKIISEWDTPAMAVFATELVCGKCHNEMGAVIFEKEESVHDLNIDYNTIRRIEPFRPNNRGKKASFYILVTRNSANSLRNPIYRPFRDYLLNECGDGMNKKDEIGWSFDIEKAIDEILLLDTKMELAIDRQLVKRILIHLKAGKHVILVGPPGVGKTDLARRILEIIGKKVIGNDSFLESVASDEWSRYELIGGVNLANEFQEGWVTKAAVDNKWLLIDEFNRANMNKAFGELFLAVEYSKITLRPTESKSYKKDAIEIPQNFRMICTMNDFDKNLLLTELSYGLISRFAFVPITPDIQREPIVVERRVKSLLGNDAIYKNCNEQIKLYFKFINDVRRQRNIGVRTSIDIVKYLVSATQDGTSSDDNYKWVSLNNALCDYVLPQFDRLDGRTIDAVLNYATSYLAGEAFTPLREELQRASSRLQKAAGWLTNKDGI